MGEPQQESHMKRILVGVDGSKESRDAVTFAAGIAGATKAQLIIATAVQGVAGFVGAPELAARADEWAQKEREEAQKLVKEIAAGVSGVPVIETQVLTGSPALALADQAKAGDVELVVVGHRGRNAVARALLGSVADRLVQICPKPVLVVR
jgi:nucleotide-binding universal stress UspA family protein